MRLKIWGVGQFSVRMTNPLLSELLCFHLFACEGHQPSIVTSLEFSLASVGSTAHHSVI